MIFDETSSAEVPRRSPASPAHRRVCQTRLPARMKPGYVSSVVKVVRGADNCLGTRCLAWVETNTRAAISGQVANRQVSSMNTGQTKGDLTLLTSMIQGSAGSLLIVLCQFSADVRGVRGGRAQPGHHAGGPPFCLPVRGVWF